jgi:hypothetical protein
MVCGTLFSGDLRISPLSSALPSYADCPLKAKFSNVNFPEQQDILTPKVCHKSLKVPHFFFIVFQYFTGTLYMSRET